MSIVMKIQVNVEFLSKIPGRNDILSAVKENMNKGKLLFVDKFGCITTAVDLIGSATDIYPVDLYRVVPSD